MSKFFKFLVASVIAIFAMSSLTACSNSDPIDMTTIAAVIDVRTLDEFASGHLDGALNIDIQGSAFATEIGALDKSANYVIYCRSGNRAGQAVTYMQDNGFTGTLTNAGSVDEASSATGIAVVQ
jgi:rhodanese-related sulfurtransferase